jgi:hypothetical protein
MRRLNVDLHRGRRVKPATDAALTGKDERLRTVIVNDGEF